MSARRLTGRGQVDHGNSLDFQWDGKPLQGLPGDTLASALLANNEWVLGRSFKYHRPRGIMSAGVEESGAIVTIGTGPRRDPNVKATTQELYSGLMATGQNAWPSVRFDVGAVSNLFGRFFAAGFYYKTFMGIPPLEWGRGTKAWMWYEKLIRKAAGMGSLSTEPDPDHYEHAHAHCDVLVVGSGPAGLAAAEAALESGLEVLLLEQEGKAGGEYRNDDSVDAINSLDERLQGLKTRGLTLMTRTTAFGLYDNNVVGAFERVTDHLETAPDYLPRHRCWTIRTKAIVIASGALERDLAFTDNDRPGIMTASSALHYLHRYGVLCGERIVVATNNDSAHECALQLCKAGAVVTLLDARSQLQPEQESALRDAGVTLHTASAPLQAIGSQGVRRVVTAVQTNGAWSRADTIDCDSLLVSGGWSPLVNLLSHRGVKPLWSESLCCFVPPEHIDVATQGNIFIVGAAAGVFSHEGCIESGSRAGASVNTETQNRTALPIAANAETATGWITPIEPLFEVKLTDPEGSWVSGGKSFIDFQHDVTADDVRLAHREGFVSVEHMKRYTTLGMATDQGKMGNVLGIAIMSEAQGRPIPEIGTTTFRPPYTPVSLGALRGRAAGNHFRALRRTPLHEWNLEQGATMIEAGLWRRPWYFARSLDADKNADAGPETLLDTANRETSTTRSKVGLCDVTSLGKIAVQGPDAARFLDRVYANNFASLAIGRARYGIMLRDDGMVMDDGTCWRLSANDYFMTTTTAQAAHVMVWLEELLQVRWPELRVHVSSVTDQWAGIAVAGPLSRQILQSLVSDADVLSNENFPFMAVGEASLNVTDGTAKNTVEAVSCRIARISFSGELAYEVYMPAGFACAVMNTLWVAGQAAGGCLYGLEALSTMRIEKGHLTGVELDGNVTIDDAGLGGMASVKKPFVGNALRQRSELVRTDRPRLVGIVPEDSTDTFNGGSILCAADNVSGHGEGWITGVAHSPELGHWIGIGYVNGGHERWQDQPLVAADPLRDAEVTVKVVSPHFLDAAGERLHA